MPDDPDHRPVPLENARPAAIGHLLFVGGAVMLVVGAFLRGVHDLFLALSEALS